MDWLFDNLGKFAPVVIFLIYMISSLKGKGEKEDEAPDPRAAERSRKIQEEIRRKILERQRGEGPPTGFPPEAEREVIAFDEPERDEESWTPASPPQAREPVPQFSAEEETMKSVGALEEHRLDMVARLKEVERLNALAREQTRSIADGALGSASRRNVSQGLIRKRLSEGLSSSDSLKTSILLSEVLDRPVGLR